jgi:hypothetical protein
MEKRDKLGEIIEEVAKVLFYIYIFFIWFNNSKSLNDINNTSPHLYNVSLNLIN